MKNIANNWCSFVCEEIELMLRDSAAAPFTKFITSGSLLRSQLLGYFSNFNENLISRAAIIELLHAASLLHDDVIDGAILRRHLPAFWLEHGVKAAILLGDLMLSICFEKLVLLQNHECMQMMAKSIRALCDGEVMQSLSIKKMPIEKIAAGKTGSLFAATAALSLENKCCLQRYEIGMNLGIAYQLIDDLADIKLTSSDLGKSTKIDVENGLHTAADWTIDTLESKILDYLKAAKKAANEQKIVAAFDAYLQNVFFFKTAKIINLEKIKCSL